MQQNPESNRRNEVYNLGFRRGANERAAAGLPYFADTPAPSLIPDAPAECSSQAGKELWSNGYKMGYVIGAADCEMQKNSHESVG
jgi:hypothetical protein